jgi:serine/threonine-protein kinase
MLTSYLLLFFGLFTNPGDTTISTEWKTLEHGDFSIQYPPDWTAESFENSVMEFTISSPIVDEEDNYADFVNLQIQNLPGLNKTLDSYVAEFSRDIPFIYQKATVRKNEKTTKARKNCYVLEYAGVFNDFPIAYRQYIWFENDKAYSLTFTAEQGSFDKWDAISQKVMDSFTFKK